MPDSIDVTRLCSAQKLQRYQMQPVQDIIQNNYTIRRVMVGHDDEEVAVMFRALVSNGGATFQISLEHHGWGHESVRSSPVMKTALSSFLTAHSLKGDASNAPAFFGISCQEVQEVLFGRRAPSLDKEDKQPQQRFARTSLKAAVRMLHPESDSEAEMFSGAAASLVVGNMISVIEQALISERNPGARTQLIIAKFIQQPDIRKRDRTAPTEIQALQELQFSQVRHTAIRDRPTPTTVRLRMPIRLQAEPLVLLKHVGFEFARCVACVAGRLRRFLLLAQLRALTL